MKGRSLLRWPGTVMITNVIPMRNGNTFKGLYEKFCNGHRTKVDKEKKSGPSMITRNSDSEIYLPIIEVFYLLRICGKI